MVYKARSPKIKCSVDLLQINKWLYRVYLQGGTIYDCVLYLYGFHSFLVSIFAFDSRLKKGGGRVQKEELEGI